MSDPRIRDRKHTEQTILRAALTVLRQRGDFTVVGIAKEAEYADRTVFRHFPTRETLLSAVGKRIKQVVPLPPPPSTLDDLHVVPRRLFTALEEHRDLLCAAFESDLWPYLLRDESREKSKVIGKLLDTTACKASAQDRNLATITLAFHLSAHGWYYYRQVARCSLANAIAASEALVAQQLNSLALPLGSSPLADRQFGIR
jgi:AcrR family transcriptional regulator